MASKFFSISVMIVLFIISLLNLSSDLHSFLGSLPNGQIYQFLFFGTIFIGSSLGLFLIFTIPSKDERRKNTAQTLSTILSVDPRTVGFKFIEGFIRGFVADSKVQTKIRLPRTS